ncbi:unnamed protein product [Ostreobium quekettii]|uniref:START domain-containing protein n=1 Tax=Ostreobium quekettii TaxID=121088 RepID=A0A8S1IJS4_9CHLO|nr:unnamed protein product [Ostreobium quekettii]|eukprot:evm.model.scf_1.14 EVM.evm.TU.scf_1.14   scf_1:289790-295921(-)
MAAAGKGAGMRALTQRLLGMAGPALLVGLFAWLMLVDGWATGWPPTGSEGEEEGEEEGSSWSQKVRRLPRDLLLVFLLGVLYLRSKAGRLGWSSPAASVTEEVPRQAHLTSEFEDLTEADIRSIKHLSNGHDCVGALQSLNASHTHRLKKAVPDIFLLHLGELMGEKSAVKALQMLGRTGEVGQPCALFGELREKGTWDSNWSNPVVKSRQGITFETSKRRWRNGLFVYRTTTVFEDCSPAQFRTFNMDTASRKSWDWSMEEWRRIEEASDNSTKTDSCFYFHEARMPGPMCNRVYGCARRVWDQPDGGCYWITKSATHPSILDKRRTVRVDEYTSGSVIRATKSRQGLSTPAVELTSVYYDDPKMRPMAYNLAMKTAFWAAMQATEHAFRKFLEESGAGEATDSQTRGLAGGRQSGRRRWRKVVRGVVWGGIAFVLHKVVK